MSTGSAAGDVNGIRMGDRGPYRTPGGGSVVGNEFAEVSVDIDVEGNSTRLRLEDLRTGRVRFLDALELETVIWLADGHLASLLDPSADRWRDK
ncbi:hypothetical protein [Streptomyces sp. NPDC046909]|uniref:hypothetical protein n=1 Tax=Streptomyces sp. NPDC046909 TaxID=3155617 RepID=UPI0033EA7B08